MKPVREPDAGNPHVRFDERVRETALLEVSGLRKVYSRGLWTRQETFRLEADFVIEEPAIVGMMGHPILAVRGKSG